MPGCSSTKVGLPALTGLRLIAALSVALAHGAAATLRIDPASNLSVVKYWLAVGAGLGMPLFFVLSGFVIHYNYATRIFTSGGKGLFEFLWARFTRLYPLYLLVIFGEVVFSGVIFNYLQGQKGPADLVFNVLPSYLTMTQSWFYTLDDGRLPIYVFGIAVPLTWSISTEWFFYLCYPLILFFVSRLRGLYSAAAGAFLFSIVFAIAMLQVTYYINELDAWAGSWFGAGATSRVNAQNSFVRWLLYFSPYARIGEFILGCLLAQLYLVLKPYRVGPLEAKIARILVPLSIFSVFVFLYVMYAPGANNTIGRLKENFGLAPAIALVLFCATRYQSRIFDALSEPRVVQLGEASYSIYLSGISPSLT